MPSTKCLNSLGTSPGISWLTVLHYDPLKPASVLVFVAPAAKAKGPVDPALPLRITRCLERERETMSNELNSSLTSIDWLPQLGISSLRSGKDRGGGGGERDKRKDRGRERGDFLPSLPDPPPPNYKGKPPHSYATLIAMAIAAAPERKLSLNDIYTWISDRFPHYSRAGRGWKVSFSSSITLLVY